MSKITMLRILVTGLTSLALLAGGVTVAPAAPDRAHDHALRSDLRADLQDFLRERGAAEHVSGLGLTLRVPGSRTIEVSAGTTTYGGGQRVDPDAVWQIGSNTKAFTSVILLQLEAEHP